MTHILQRREQYGLIRTIEKSPHPFDQEEVLANHGPGYYCDKETTPRFHVIWKSWLGDPSQRNDLGKKLSRDVQDLKKKSFYLAIGEGLLALGEGLGFGVTAIKLNEYGKRLTVIESMVVAINAKNPIGFVCPTCQQLLADPLQPFCGNCGDRMDWTSARIQNIASKPLCSNCFNPVRPRQNFCTRCGRALAIQNNESTTLQFVPLQHRGLQ